MKNKELVIYPDFKKLVIPLARKAYLQLENSIRENGCETPILVWHGIIVDGHKRFEICSRYGINYEVNEMEFDSRESVISWICEMQLKRRDISFEARKFLIGMQYEAEKVMSHRRSHKDLLEECKKKRGRPLNKNQIEHKTAHAIGEKNFISHTTVQKYAVFTRALEEIGKKEPSLVPKLLSGEYKFSHNQIIAISQLSSEDVKKFNRKIEIDPTPYLYQKYMRNDHPAEREEGEVDTSKSAPSVKDMPQYDPDAEINSLALTIPSWKSSIERTKAHANLSAISPEARKKVLKALFELRITISDMMITIQEEK